MQSKIFLEGNKSYKVGDNVAINKEYVAELIENISDTIRRESESDGFILGTVERKNIPSEPDDFTLVKVECVMAIPNRVLSKVSQRSLDVFRASLG